MEIKFDKVTKGRFTVYANDEAKFVICRNTAKAGKVYRVLGMKSGKWEGEYKSLGEARKASISFAKMGM